VNKFQFSIRSFGIGIVAALLAAAIVLFTLESGFPQPLGAVRVIDGDTIVTDGNKARLMFIDAPEKSQPFGASSTAYLESLMDRADQYVTMPEITGKSVKETDRYGRLMVYVLAGETSVQSEMVKAGLAWVYPQYCKVKDICDSLKRDEAEARAARHGLWSDENPVAPWEYRKHKGK
jgi:endonuclease YncB( thermonuclease family)